MNGRVYDPTIARFISADPNIFHPFDTQDFNRYAYTRNNPLRYVDPSGYGWDDNDYEDGDFDDRDNPAGSQNDNQAEENHGSNSDLNGTEGNGEDPLEVKKDIFKKDNSILGTLSSLFTSLLELIREPDIKAAAKISATPVNMAINIHSIATAENKQKESSKVAGSLSLGVGGVFAGGLFFGPPGSVVFGILGEFGGRKAGGTLYDSNKNDLHDEEF